MLPSISKITAHFLKDHHAWIFAPTRVQYEVSEDGTAFSSVGATDIPIPASAEETSIVTVSHPVPAVKARYIRVSAKNLGRVPFMAPWEGREGLVVRG